MDETREGEIPGKVKTRQGTELSLPEQEHLLRVDEVPGSEAVEVDAGG